MRTIRKVQTLKWNFVAAPIFGTPTPRNAIFQQNTANALKSLKTQKTISGYKKITGPWKMSVERDGVMNDARSS